VFPSNFVILLISLLRDLSAPSSLHINLVLLIIRVLLENVHFLHASHIHLKVVVVEIASPVFLIMDVDCRFVWLLYDLNVLDVFEVDAGLEL